MFVCEPDKETKVRINYSKYPREIESAVVRLSDEQSLSLSINKKDSTSINIEVRDNAFGAEYMNNFVLDNQTAKDVYSVLYQLLKQVEVKDCGV